jgi:hypothetical protein
MIIVNIVMTLIILGIKIMFVIINMLSWCFMFFVVCACHVCHVSPAYHLCHSHYVHYVYHCLSCVSCLLCLLCLFHSVFMFYLCVVFFSLKVPFGFVFC